jgi:transposase, IS5 family
MQLSFGDGDSAGKRTRREVFPVEPDETAILNFRRLLETHVLARESFERVNAHLARKDQSQRAGTIVAAPSSTKSAEGKRGPEMHRKKKGNQWHFGMKAHIGVDEESGLVHSAGCNVANVADTTQVQKSLHGEEYTVCGDSGCTDVEKRRDLSGVKARLNIAEKPSKLSRIRGKRYRAWAERWERIIELLDFASAIIVGGRRFVSVRREGPLKVALNH